MDIYFKTKAILEFGVPLVVFSVAVLVLLFYFIKGKIDKIFKSNCYECKKYKLYDVSGSGGRCRYKCNLYNRIDKASMNQEVKLMKCKDFEK